MSDERLTDKTVVEVRVIDIVATARMLGMDMSAITGRPMPEHDYRFSLAIPAGGEVTFSQDATAEHVAAYCEHKGWLSKP